MSRVLIQLLALAVLWCATTANARPFSELDGTLQAAAAQGQFSGVVRIVEKDRVLFEKAYGSADAPAGVPMTTDIYFDLASLTKHVTGAAILLLHQRGRLSVRDPLKKYVANLRPEVAELSLLSLLTHRSGLGYPNDRHMGPMLDRLDDPQAFFEFFLNHADILAKPGERFEYNNLAYSLLAFIVSKVSGASFEDFVQNEIFTPLQADCDFARDRVPVSRRALGFDGREVTFYAGSAADSWGLRGSTGAVCTAKGVTDLELGLLRGQILPRELLDQYYFLKSWGATPAKPGERYSFGWFFADDGRVWHSGSVAGFLANLSVDTRRERVIVVLTNNENSGPLLSLPDKFF